MSRRQHVKNRDKKVQEKLAAFDHSDGRRPPIPRPCTFTPKTAYNRKRLPKPADED